ncbi:MAG: 4'-phosphopantetheinyl transferase superfamily protein [Bacteroidaceae bacterium]|nr:4'-phosphopantetheinyl transferase superfamily protein [Bacteroidaceae bacterium]
MIYYDKQTDGIRVVVWHVTEEYEELLSMLPDADSVQNEAEQQFSSEFRRVEWTAVRVLLYTVLDRQVHINYNDQGAPLLPDYEGLHISISHTKGFVAIALSESDVVGVDVEQIERLDTTNQFDDKEKMPRVEKVRSRFMGNDEYAETIVGMLLHWSAKETVFKVLGREGVDFHDDLKVQPFDETQYEGDLQLDDLKEDDTYTIYYKVFDDFVLTYTKRKQDE